MTLLAGTEPATPDPAPATTEADTTVNPEAAAEPTDGPSPAPHKVGKLVRLETSWPEPSVQHLLVVDVDDRGWIRTVQVSEPSGYMPPDTVSAD